MTGKHRMDSRLLGLSACVAVTDLDASVQWYGRVLGFEAVTGMDFPDLDAEVVFLKNGRIRLELVTSKYLTMMHRPDPPRHAHVSGVAQICFYTDDMEEVLSHLREGGVPLAMAPVDVPELSLRGLFIRDPSGNLIEFIEPRHTADDPA